MPRKQRSRLPTAHGEPTDSHGSGAGGGGGNNAFHLKNEFEMTLVDLSDEMLTVSRQLNPGCDHLQGDMRTLRLGRSFDAVFVRRHRLHDHGGGSTASGHRLRTLPGGVAVLVPDNIAENFEPALIMAAMTRRTAAVRATSPGPATRTRRYPHPRGLRLLASTDRRLRASGARHARIRPLSAGPVAPGAD